MLTAAVSLSLRVGSCGRAMATVRPPMVTTTRLMQQRSYIFLPSSFQELQQMVRDAWDVQKERRRTVWVKLWHRQRPKQNAAVVPTRRRFRRALSNRTKHFRMRRHRSYLASKRRLLNAKQLIRDRARSVHGNMRDIWEYRSLLLTEKSHPNWFDSYGYPKAVRNAYGRFLNPWNSQSTNGMKSFYLFLRWRMERLCNKVLRRNAASFRPTALPSQPLAFQVSTPPKGQIRFSWLGHSTTLVELQGFTVLTDPIFCVDRTDPFPIGVARYTPPPCTVDDLPEQINVCAISHDHYDHLDQSTVEELKGKVQYWAVPLGMSEWLQKHCEITAASIIEMTWWESKSLGKNKRGELDVIAAPTTDTDVLELVCTPAQHWCGRNMFDRNLRLWCSWVIRAGPFKYFFAGDTARPDSFPLHRQIGDRLGPFDVAALPIGAYSPSYFMSTSHAHPTEAVKIHQDLQAIRSVAIHWGSFDLSEERHDEPPRLLERAAREAGVNFIAMPQGNSIVVSSTEQEGKTAARSQDDEDIACG